MNDDFLGSLAVQTLGVASGIRPRLVSNFERRLAASDSFPRWSEPTELEVDPLATQESAENEASAHNSPLRPRPVERAPDLATISPIAGRVMTWEIQSEKDALTGPLLPSEPLERASGIGSVDLPVQPDLRQEAPSMVTSHAITAPDQDNTGTQEARPVRPTQFEEGIRPVRQSGVPVQTRRAERDAVAPHEAAGSEPTIQVTIGRVEVRATTAPPTQPASQQAARPTSPIMTLEDYLRRKAEQGNR
jgi:hypothetical protein